MSEKIAEIVEKIKALTLVEASELKTALEDEFGVTAAAPVVIPAIKNSHGGYVYEQYSRWPLRRRLRGHRLE